MTTRLPLEMFKFALYLTVPATVGYLITHPGTKRGTSHHHLSTFFPPPPPAPLPHRLTVEIQL